MKNNQLIFVLQGLLAAFLFGINTPLSKLLALEMDPILLAGLFYLGAAVGLQLVRFIWGFIKRPADAEAEAQIKKGDYPWLAGAIITGGVAAPILLLYSLRVTPAGTGSLLINFESVMTTFIAGLAFKEAISRRVWWAILIITCASILLTLDVNSSWGISIGAMGVLIAYFLWGLNNNLERHISAKDPLSMVIIKGFIAGSFSLVLAFLLGSRLPDIKVIAGAMLVGSLCYGLSIVAFVYAMRGLGAGRAGVLLGTAPLYGVILSFILLREVYNFTFLIALPLMFAGTFLLTTEDHNHIHTHDVITHEHRHRHDDDHHHHTHPIEEFAVRSHSHLHTHPRMEHTHAHLPDIHHRHEHGDR